MGDEELKSIVENGSVPTLRKVHAIESRMVSKLSMEMVAQFYEMKSEMHTPELAVFVWCNQVGLRQCCAYRVDADICFDLNCTLHVKCIVCNDVLHNAVDVVDGVIATHCPVVRRIGGELQMMKNCWQVNGARLWRYLDNL